MLSTFVPQTLTQSPHKLHFQAASAQLGRTYITLSGHSGSQAPHSVHSEKSQSRRRGRLA